MYELWQLEKYGNVLSSVELFTMEEQHEADRQSELDKINDYWEREQDNHFNN